MCRECGFSFCPSVCPNFNGYLPSVGRRVAACVFCGGDIYADERSYAVGGGTLCSSCAEDLVSEELLGLLGCRDHDEFFRAW